MDKIVSFRKSSDTSGARKWNMPLIGSQKKLPPLHLENEVETKNVYDKAKADGHNAGYQEGMLKAKREIENIQNELRNMISLFESPISKIDELIEKELVALVVEISRLIISNELSIKPEYILSIINEAKNALPITTGEIKLCMNKEDLSAFINLKEEKYLDEYNFHVEENANLSRGEIILLTNETKVVSTIDERLKNIIEKIQIENMGKE